MQKMLYRIERCRTGIEFQQAVKNYIKAGYTLESTDAANALLIKRKRKARAGAISLAALRKHGIAGIIDAFIPSKIEDEVMVILENE